MTKLHWLPALLLCSSVPAAGADAQEEPSVGWFATYEWEGGALSERVPAAAFFLHAGATIHPELPPGFSASFETVLSVSRAGDYRFGLEVEGGAASIAVLDGDVELDRFTLGASGSGVGAWLARDFGELRLRVRFERDGDGASPARLRTRWEMRITDEGGFGPEPVPSLRTAVPRDAPSTRQQEAAFRGRLLLERKGCTNCHATRALHATGQRRAPDLGRVAERASASWLQRWIAAPRSVRARADMPALVTEGESLALTAFLSSLAGAEAASDAPLATEPQVLDQGRALYHRRGCVACHGALASPAELFGDDFLASDVPDVDVPAPFGDLAGKWRPTALRDFLLDPAEAFPDGRMPSSGLTVAEADLIAAYLLAGWRGEARASAHDPALAARGRGLFDERRCDACHELSGTTAPAPSDTPIEALDPAAGCLDPNDTHTPRYDLGAEERRLLAAGIASIARASAAPAPLDAARRTLERLSCASCHAMNGAGGVPGALRVYFPSEDEDTDMGDEGRIPPDLSGVGFKLTTRWLDGVLMEGQRARPYLAARMPHYAQDGVDGLAEGLAQLEGLRPHSDALEPEANDELVRAGREMMGRGALGCIACHVYKDHPAATMPGPALEGFGERLRYEWFFAYMQDPQRYKRGTRMPGFGRGNVSTLRSVFDGDLTRQRDAMWAYFSLGEFMPAPDGIEPVQGTMRIDVADRPRVLRTFLEVAGSRGIAVGFPTGLHVSFDAGSGRLADAWRGSFLDASGAWAGRGGSIAGGRGELVWTAPARPALRFDWPGGEAPVDALEDDADTGEPEVDFRGYRLEADGTPVFLYSIDGIEVEERVHTEVAPTERIVRDFKLTGVPRLCVVNVSAGAAESVLTDVHGARAFESTVALVPDHAAHLLTFDDPSGELTFRLEVLP